MQISTCRSCGARIIWVRMTSGKAMPCDAQKISFNPVHPVTKEAQTYITEDGKVCRGEYDPNGEKNGYISHFATCPAADQHRRPR